jgi:hypothetical protein
MFLSFTFPHMFWLLALLPLLVGVKFLADLRGQRYLQRAVAAKLRPQLIAKHHPWREWLVLGLELAALAAFITALARPQFGFTEEEVKSSGRSLMIQQLHLPPLSSR